ncbi:UNVERIFIED_CONTAM: WD repeat-containing protein 63 [Trichonephila clavipes]
MGRRNRMLLLEYFDDISVIKFNPVKPNLLAAGSLSGQLVLWDVKPDTYMSESDDNNKFNSLAGFMTPPVARCIAISSMDHMHKYGITDLLWVPPSVEISFRGDIVKDAPGGFQIITSGLDGQVVSYFFNCLLNCDHFYKLKGKKTLNYNMKLN